MREVGERWRKEREKENEIKKGRNGRETNGLKSVVKVVV